VMLLGETDQGNFIFGHAGGNDPAISTFAAINPDTGDGIIALSNGDTALPIELALTWSFWQTNKRSLFYLLVQMATIFSTIMYGCAVIIVLTILFAVYKRKAA